MDELKELFSGFEDRLDANQETVKKTVEMLFDDEKIYYTSRLTPERMENVIKNVIILTFYQKFYQVMQPMTMRHAYSEKMKCICTEPSMEDLPKGKDCPFCKGKPLETQVMYAVTEVEEDKVTEQFRDVYENFIKDMLKLTVSEKGLGRKEAIEIILNNQKMIEAQKLAELRRPIT